MRSEAKTSPERVWQFSSVANLWLITVMKNMRPAGKQEESPRYHGRDNAVMRAKRENALVLLGSGYTFCLKVTITRVALRR